MSRIHRSWALLGLRSALRCGTARFSTVRSIAYSTHGSVITARPIHSRRVAFDTIMRSSGIREIKPNGLEAAAPLLQSHLRQDGTEARLIAQSIECRIDLRESQPSVALFISPLQPRQRPVLVASRQIQIGRASC